MGVPHLIKKDIERVRFEWDDKSGESLTEDQWSLLESYASILYEASLKLNLVSPADRDVLVRRHVWRALSMGPFIEAIPNETILDVGSGSGIPAIPLKIYFPTSRFYLLESRRKRANFLRNVIRKLNLEDITVINSRVEDWNGEVVADVVTARSVANPTLLRDWVVSHVHDRSVLVCTLHKSGEVNMKGAKDVLLASGEETMRLGIIPL
ncbi:MAG: 16S rRNA (guanine(527)-N(7))-methyltransferase RsmG [Actinomycetota bacterium]|nr:16S rRNA (guanine(527)-N(7))-methyltransferase RsmG [Actinomycetota bacterium]MEE2726723.1 16S rRNA (guanine(527)-N(7))-methyltransferase RsmG [Candidatus Latescibacterota bacterium]